MPVGTTAAILLGIGAAGAGVAASKGGFFGGVAKAAVNAGTTPLPQPPSSAAANETAANIVRKRTSDATQTIFTGPLGLQDQANVAKKVLLGQ